MKREKGRHPLGLHSSSPSSASILSAPLLLSGLSPTKPYTKEEEHKKRPSHCSHLQILPNPSRSELSPPHPQPVTTPFPCIINHPLFPSQQANLHKTPQPSITKEETRRRGYISGEPKQKSEKEKENGERTTVSAAPKLLNHRWVSSIETPLAPSEQTAPTLLNC